MKIYLLIKCEDEDIEIISKHSRRENAIKDMRTEFDEAMEDNDYEENEKEPASYEIDKKFDFSKKEGKAWINGRWSKVVLKIEEIEI